MTLRLGFSTVADLAYVVERGDSLDTAAWTTVTNLAPSGVAADRVITDVLTGNQAYAGCGHFHDRSRSVSWPPINCDFFPKLALDRSKPRT